jgi:hypothetical protein
MASMLMTSRRAPRHCVEIPCEVVLAQADEPVLRWATDMSAEGVWLEDGDLRLGDELVVCFRPGIWWRRREIMVFAEVARVSPGLRPSDRGPGVGVAFRDLSGPERWALRCWLRPRPETAPARRRGSSRSFAPPLAAVSPFASRVC